jgi:hypothetical protein
MDIRLTWPLRIYVQNHDDKCILRVLSASVVIKVPKTISPRRTQELAGREIRTLPGSVLAIAWIKLDD